LFENFGNQKKKIVKIKRTNFGNKKKRNFGNQKIISEIKRTRQESKQIIILVTRTATWNLFFN